NAEPCGNSAIATALLDYAALSGQYRQHADNAIAAGMAIAHTDARFAGWSLAAAQASLAGPTQVAIIGADDTAAAMTHAVRFATNPGLVLIHAGHEQPDTTTHPLLAGRTRVDGQSTAYVCHGFTCQQPVTTVAELEAQLG